MRTVAVFMKRSMPGPDNLVKVPSPTGTNIFSGSVKRAFDKGVRCLFMPLRDYGSRIGLRDHISRIDSCEVSMRRAFAMLGMGAAVLMAAGSLTLLPHGTQASTSEAT